ncbi:hypothetical protein [Enterococcus alishanensis]
MLLLLILGACTNSQTSQFSGKVSPEKKISKENKNSDLKQEILSEDNFFKEIITNGLDPIIQNKLTYKVNSKNSDWKNTIFTINEVRLVNVSDFSYIDDKEYKTLISLKYKIKNTGSEMTEITPQNIKINFLGRNKEVKGISFDDVLIDMEISLNETKGGYFYIGLNGKEDLKSIDGISFDLENSDSENHSYKINL